MSTAPKILAFAGSTRKESFNIRMLRIAVGGARAAGADVTHVDLADYPLPLFNQDDHTEHGIPEHCRKLKALMLASQGFLIASPEYNSSITPLLKNTIDWTSRSEPGEPSLACFTDKVAVLMSASPGALGGMRGLVHLRAILGNIGTIVLPTTLSIPLAMNAFDKDGSILDRARHAAVAKLGADLAAFLRKLRD